MINGRIENFETLQMCRECQNKRLLRNQPCKHSCACTDFCERIKDADNALALYKKCRIDIKTSVEWEKALIC